MSLICNGQPQPTSAAITGQYLAKAHLTYRQCVKLAAALSTGAAVLSPMTIGQAAALVGVPVADVSRVRRLNGKPPSNGHNDHHHGDGRATNPEANLSGLLDRLKSGRKETLAEHISRSSPEERTAAGREVGPAVIWDTMIVPIVSEERAAGTNVAE
jgi:hypothetical protein